MKDRNKIMRFFGLHPQNDVRRKFAFTLAEVLVTLGIIGVVAVLTVPNVISNYQKKVYVVQLQKAYNQLQQVFSLAMAEDEVEYLADTELMQSINNRCIDGVENVPEDGFVEQLSKYLRITKACQVGEFDNGCHDIAYSYVDSDIKMDNVLKFKPGELQIFTKDGMIFYFSYWFCNSIYYSSENEVGLTCEEIKASGGNVCYALSDNFGHELSVDINGKKGPNKYGRDLFNFVVDEKGNLYPWGSISVYGENMYWANTQGDIACTPDAVGHGCAGRIFDEGWQINY